MVKYEEKKKRRNKEKQKEKKKQSRKVDTEAMTSYWLLAPLIAIAAFIPLVMRFYQYDPKLQGFNWYAGSEMQVDYFLHCKMVLLIIAGFYILGAIVWLYFSSGKKLSWTSQFIPLVAYGALTIVSTLLSNNSYFSINGSFEQFEPVWLLLGYCLIAYYAFLVLRSEEAMKRFMRWFIAGVTIMMALGVAQGLGHNPLSNPWVQKLYAPREAILSEGFEMGMVYLTLYNPNYVGVYMVLIIPMVFAGILTAKKLWQKMGCGILLLVSVYVLYMSRSKAAILSLPISFLMLALLYRKNNIIRRIVLICVVAVLIFFFSINIFKDNFIISQIKNAFTPMETEYALESIETKKDCVRITYQHETLDICSQQQDGKATYLFKDGAGKTIQPVFNGENKTCVFDDERFPFYFVSIEAENFKGFGVTIEGYRWLFSNRMEMGDTTYYAYRSTHSLPMKLKKDTQKYNSFLEKHHGLFTGRGYIWARTLPLLKKYFWTGSGPDTFMIAFPNEDMVGRANRHIHDTYTTKPHSLYLQIGVQTGIPSLLCILIFFGWYLIDSFRLYWKSEDTGYLSKVGRCLFVSVIGYLIVGLTNDSSNAVTPIFYLLIGTGAGINHTLKKQVEKSI